MKYQLFILFTALSALMVRASKESGKLTEEQKKFMGNSDNWGKGTWTGSGYNHGASSPPKGNPGYDIKGIGHDAGSAYGTGHSGGQGSVGGSSSGKQADSSSGSKSSGGGFFGSRRNKH